MFKFNGTLAQLRTYLDATFTKTAQKNLQLGVFAQSRTVQARGTRKEVAAMLALVYTAKHLKNLTLDVEIYQPLERFEDGRVLTLQVEEWPFDLCLADVHATIRGGSYITAIKAYRTLMNVGLADAKEYCDRYRESVGIHA